MIFIEVCVGSSCHLKGAPRIVELLQEKIAKNKLEDEIVLTGAFCSGRCNRIGVTITPESFGEFWDKTIMPAVQKAKEE